MSINKWIKNLLEHSFLSSFLCYFWKHFFFHVIFSCLVFKHFLCDEDICIQYEIAESVESRNISFWLYFNAAELLHFKQSFGVLMMLQVWISIQPDLESRIWFFMLNDHSTICSIKMLRQGQTKLLNTVYLFVLNTLFHQTSNLPFSSGNDNSKSGTYFCISDEYSPEPLDKKFQSKFSNFKGFWFIKDDWCYHGSKAQTDLRRGLFKLNFF